MAAAALRGSADEATAVGASGAALTVAGGGIVYARRHRGGHRLVASRKNRAAPPVTELGSDVAIESTADVVQPAVVAAMSTPPAPRADGVQWAPPAWAPPAQEPGPALFLVPAPDPMVDTVPHPVVKLFPLAELEPDRAAGTIDERVYAAIDEERRLAEAAALASGRHASSTPYDAAVPRRTSYRSRHSA